MSGQRCSGQSRQGPEAPGVNGGSRGEIGMAGGIEVTRVLRIDAGGVNVLLQSQDRAPGVLAPCLRGTVCLGLGSGKMFVEWMPREEGCL